MTEEERLQEHIKELEKKIADYEKQEKTIKKLTGKFLLFIFKIFIGKGLKEAFYKLFAEIKEKKTTTVDTLAELAAAIVRRFTRIGLISLIIVFTPLIFSVIQVCLLSQQNDLVENQNAMIDAQTQLFKNQNTMIDSQNQLFEKQTNRLDQQTYLQEAERRSSLVFLMGNIFDEVNNELREKSNNKRQLSPQLIGRIIALSHSLIPYKSLRGDKLTRKEYSAERGQLLITLVNSGINKNTLRKIYEKSNFKHSYLVEGDLSNAYLCGIDLSGSTMYYANLQGANLSHATLKNVTLIEANLDSVNLNHSVIHKTELYNAKLNHTDFTFTYLDTVWVNKRADIDPSVFNKNFIDSTFFGKVIKDSVDIFCTKK